MEKNWLIRTKNNHILGPVTKAKVRELIEKGSIKGEDEVSCGNGYWIYIREKELVNKYIVGEMVQGFNPVSEADTVIQKHQDSNSTQNSINLEKSDDGKLALPEQDDLEYPDMETQTPDVDDLEYPDINDTVEATASVSDATQAVSVSELREKLKVVPEEPIYEEESFDDEDEYENENEENSSNKYKKKTVKLSQRRVKKKDGSVGVKSRNDNFLIYLAIIFLILVIGVFVLRKPILKKFMYKSIDNLIFNNAYAQVTTPVVNVSKKKL